MLSSVILLNKIYMGLVQEQLICKLNKIPFPLNKTLRETSQIEIKESHTH